MSIDPKLSIFDMSNRHAARAVAYKVLAAQNSDQSYYKLVDCLFDISDRPGGVNPGYFSLMLSLATMPTFLHQPFGTALLLALLALQERIEPLVAAIAAADNAGDEDAKLEAIRRLERILHQGKATAAPKGGAPEHKLGDDVN